MPQSKKSKAPKTDPVVDYPESAYQPLPNKEAIVAFNGKALLTSESYLDVKAYQHALAFTVAGLMDEDLLKETRDAIKSALENGTDFRTFKQRLKPYLMSKGWLSETLDDGTQKMAVGSNRRLRTIYSTNLQSAYSAGQWSRIQETKAFLPYLQYMPSVSENPRLSHKKYYGLCRPADDVIWQSIMPSNGWGCKCWVKQLTKKQAQKVGVSDEKPLETQEYVNPKTGEKSQIPLGIDPSFVHNHDPMTAILRLAEDRHGKEFADKLKQQAEKLLPDTLPIVPIASVTEQQPTPNMSPDIDIDFMQMMRDSAYNANIEKYLADNPEIAKTAKALELSDEEIFSLMGYTKGHGAVQSYLYRPQRFNKSSPEFVKMAELQIGYIKSALAKLPNFEGKVIRNVSNYADFALLNKGDVFSSKAFMSSSIAGEGEAFAGRKVKMILHTKTGKQIDWLSVKPYQKEVLILPDTKFEVNEIEQKGEVLWLTMTEILSMSKT